jgi:hypothetical protein
VLKAVETRGFFTATKWTTVSAHDIAQAPNCIEDKQFTARDQVEHLGFASGALQINRYGSPAWQPTIFIAVSGSKRLLWNL